MLFFVLVYLIYLDESGRSGRGSDEHFVVGGLAVHEEDCWPLGREVEGVLRRLVADEPGLEVHATDIFAGRRRWARYPSTVRRAVLESVFDLLANWRSHDGGQPPLFGCVVHKASSRHRSCVETGFDQLLARADSFLTREYQAGNPHRSVAVADRSSYEALIQRLAPDWKAGQGAKRLHGLVEVPLFVDSRASRIVQLADAVAWATWNYYERGHDEYFSRIVNRFDNDMGVQHGLVHMVNGYRACACTACSSRVHSQIPETVPNWTKIRRPDHEELTQQAGRARAR